MWLAVKAGEVGKRFISSLKNDTCGATAIEYGLIAALIAVGIIAALTTLQDELTGIFNQVADNLSSAAATAG